MPLFRRNVCNQGSPQLRRLTALAVFLSAFFLAASANAATYYVATNGNDSNAGSQAAPWRSVGHAVNKMVAGDTTYVKSGVYNEGLIRFSRSGTESAPITLMNAPGAFPVIDFGTPTGGYSNVGASGGMVLFQNADELNKPIGWITLEGFEIRDGYVGIKFYNLHNSMIRRNWVHHNISQGILGQGGHHLLFDRNIVNHNGDFATCAAGGVTNIGTSMCNQQHGFYMHGTSYVITNNLIYDNLAFGIQVNGSPTAEYKPTKHAGPEFAGASGWIIANNTFAYNNYRAGLVLWDSPQNMRIENNIFYQNCLKAPSKCGPNVQGINVGPGVRGVSIRNNFFYATSGATLPFTPGRPFTESGNIVNKADPNFVNASGADFHLKSGSPAIDKGVALAEVTWDHDGGKRPFGAAYDIGAYEFGAPPDSGSPSIIPIGGGIPGLPSSPPVFLSPDGKVCPSGYTSSTR